MEPRARKKREINLGRHCTRFPSITVDARILGVSREHLFKVLTGARISHSLLYRYHKLKQQQEDQP